MVEWWDGELGEWGEWENGTVVRWSHGEKEISQSINHSFTQSLIHSIIQSGLKHHPEIFTAIDFNTHWLFEPYMADIVILVKGGK